MTKLREHLEACSKENKELKKEIKTLTDLNEVVAANFRAADKQIETLSQDLADMIDHADKVSVSMEAPFVHCKVEKVSSGKFPKTTVSVSAGGAIEQMDMNDVSSFAEALMERITVEVQNAIDKVKDEEKIELQ